MNLILIVKLKIQKVQLVDYLDFLIQLNRNLDMEIL